MENGNREELSVVGGRLSVVLRSSSFATILPPSSFRINAGLRTLAPRTSFGFQGALVCSSAFRRRRKIWRMGDMKTLRESAFLHLSIQSSFLFRINAGLRTWASGCVSVSMTLLFVVPPSGGGVARVEAVTGGADEPHRRRGAGCRGGAEKAPAIVCAGSSPPGGRDSRAQPVVATRSEPAQRNLHREIRIGKAGVARPLNAV